MPRNPKLRFAVLAASIQGKLDRAKRAAALEILKNVIFLTPVDTGRARSNWFVGIGQPVKTPDSTINPGANKNQGFPGKLNQGKNKILSAPILGQDIFLSNNLPYIAQLNDGTSEQAAAGFVERAIQSGVNTIRNIKF